MKELDESKLIKDIEDGKYPFVKFIHYPIGQHNYISANGTMYAKFFETQWVKSSIANLINTNPNSQIYIFNGSGLFDECMGPYWMKEVDLYDPTTFEHIKTMRHLRAAIIRLSPFEINSELNKNKIDGPIQSTNKKKYKLLLIS